MRKPGVIQQAPISRLSTSGDRVTIELEKPFRPLLSTLAHFSTAILSPDSYDSEGNVVDIKGTGPYTVATLAPPHKLNVTRFEDYYDTAPSIRELHYLTGHRAESRALQAQSGQADLIYTLDPASLDMLQQSDTVDVVSESIPRTVIIKLNNEHRFLNDKGIRQALSLALDREGIASHIIRVPESEAYQLFPPALSHWHVENANQMTQNIEQAKALIQSQGWQMAEDGIMTREGERFSLNMVTYADRLS